MALELGTAYISIIPSALGLQKNLERELAPVSGIASVEGAKAGSALGGSFEQKLSGTLARAGNVGASFGLPFVGTLNAVSTSLDRSSAKGKTFGSTLAKVGGVEALAAGAGIALLSGSAVKAARDFESSQAQLQVAVKNTGDSFASAEPGIGKTDDAMRKLGFTDTDTESSLARLTGATHSVAKAQGLEAEAADLARFKHEDLGTATSTLVLLEAGRFRGLGQLGVKTSDLTGKTDAVAIALQRLSTITGGAAQANMATLDGKLAAVRAEGDKLEVTLGAALIPKIEGLASGTVGAVQGFESANRATDGWLGKLTLAAAAVPAAVFALEKLNGAGAKVAGQFARVGDALGVTAAASEAAAGSEAALAVAESTRSAAVLPLVSAQQAEAAAALESVAADQALAAIQFELAQSASVEAAALGELAAASEAAAVAKAHLAAASATAAAAGVTGGAGAAAGAGGILGVGALGLEGVAVAGVGVALGNAELSQHAQDMSLLGKAAVVTGQSLQGLVPGANVVTAALGFLGVGHKKNTDATKADTFASLQNAVAKAKEQLANDAAAGKTSKLAADKKTLADASKRLVAVEQTVTGVLNSSSGALDSGAGAATKGAFAYLGLAAGVKTAADALTAISTRAFAPITTSISIDTAQTGVQSALDALNNPPAASGGAGGGETPTAKALDLIQKNLTLRDSELGISQAAQGVIDAQRTLTQAQSDQSASVKSLKEAQEAYRTTLHGVAADSLAAKTATDALTQAQNDASGAKLSVDAARRALATAKNDKALLGLAVQDARNKLAADKGGGAGAVTTFVPTPSGSKQVSSGGSGPASAEEVRKDQIALNDALIAATGADDSVKQAQLALSDAQLAAKQKTKDLGEAQRVLNGTLHGFPPASKEAQAAQTQLTQADTQARQATDAVTQAREGLTTATDQTANAQLALLRAQADVDGKLTASTGAAAAAAAYDSLTTRVDNAKTAIQQLGEQDAQQARQQARHAGQGIYAALAAGVLAEIDGIRAAMANQPLLAGEFDQVLANLQQQYTANVVKSQQDVLVPVGAGSNRLKPHAAGGPVTADQPLWVGERGPEVFVPRVAGDIVPNHSLANSRPMAAGGDTISITIPGNIYGINDLEKQLIAALENHTRRNGALPRTIRVSG